MTYQEVIRVNVTESLNCSLLLFAVMAYKSGMFTVQVEYR